MWQSLVDYHWLCLSAFLAGGINALAGGGTLLTFPMLIGVLSRQFGSSAGVLANGTSTVALVPASLAGAWAFRREVHHLRRLLVWLLPPSVVGGGVGAWLAVQFPDQFNALIPWLILSAALLFTLQPYVTRRPIRSQPPRHDISDADTPIPCRSLAGMVALQLLIAIYGGYFGAGIGILMLSGLGIMGLSNIHQMNGLKTLLATAINGVAVVIFTAKSNVVWPFAGAMMATSIVGGFLAAHYSRQIPGKYVRWFVMTVGFVLATYYFAKSYFDIA
jgi:uncharacterized protein